jgi:phosphoribulokinase
MRDCFDVKVYLDPPEDLRVHWKVKRDTSKRGYTHDEVAKDLQKREPDSAAFIRPQREFADIVVRFHPSGPDLEVGGALAVRLVLRPTLPHPYLIEIAEQTRIDHYQPLRLMLARDRGKPVDVLEVDGSIPPEISNKIEDVIWDHMHKDGSHVDRDAIGEFFDGNEVRRSESLAVTQLLLVHQLMGARVSA